MKYVIIFLLAFVQSCADCDSYTKLISNDECNLVVKVPPSEYSNLFKTKGYDPITHEEKICNNENRWWNQYKKEIAEGDTIVKKKGELVFYIHKKDTIIAHEWVCYDGEGKHVYH